MMPPQGMDPRQQQLPQRSAQLMAMMRMLLAGNQPPGGRGQAGGQDLAAMFRDQQGRNGGRMAVPGQVFNPPRYPQTQPTPTNLFRGDVWRAPRPGMRSYLRSWANTPLPPA